MTVDFVKKKKNKGRIEGFLQAHIRRHMLHKYVRHEVRFMTHFYFNATTYWITIILLEVRADRTKMSEPQFCFMKFEKIEYTFFSFP